MIKRFINSFGTTMYVQIWEKRIKVTNIETGKIYDEAPLVAIETVNKDKKAVNAVGNKAALLMGKNIEVINPFSHPRVLFSDFHVAEKLLQHIFKLLTGGKIFILAPAVVIHPMEKTEGGLTLIEERAFRELALGAGARDVVIYQGSPLPIHGFNYEAIKAMDKESTINRGSSF
ncbi:rod shape-determining protein [Sulfuriflexus mobilis]|uniref:rod shape-determining protein n=1 Tax=Sulfuriflexus mobilis TaxID=1811807 RepID=UPI000F81CB9B|nr:rod shape-determining protein [Sulfuriflexus mobilis]